MGDFIGDGQCVTHSRACDCHFIGDGQCVTHSRAYNCREKYFRDLEKENKRLLQWVEDLQSGLYINCVYCGHRYPPGTPEDGIEIFGV